MTDDNSTKHVNVGHDMDGHLIVGNGNSIVNNDIDGEELGQSLGEAISFSERRARFEERSGEAERRDSRRILETVFISIVSGLLIGVSWKFAFPWNAETVTFFVIGTTVLFNVLRVTDFGLRHSITKIFLLSLFFFLLLQWTSLIQVWMDINPFIGVIVLGTNGAIIGLVAGVIQLFWQPLGD